MKSIVVGLCQAPALATSESAGVGLGEVVFLSQNCGRQHRPPLKRCILGRPQSLRSLQV